MKNILSLQCMFKLPDDFNGGLIEALEVLVEYEKSKRAQSAVPSVIQLTPDDCQTNQKTEQVLWDNLHRLPTGQHFVCHFQIYQSASGDSYAAAFDEDANILSAFKPDGESK